jgi:Ser/Thr protein kinase RdoA (MazF antagonist)
VTEPAGVLDIAGRFALAAPAATIVPFGRGLINETFLVSSGLVSSGVVSSGRHEYVLQRINRAVFAQPDALMENILTVSDHLTTRFMPDLVPRLVPETGGGWVVRDGDDVWRAWLRVPGADPVEPGRPEQAGAAAHLLGRFHAGVADLDPARVHETRPGFHDPLRRLADLRTAIESDPVGRVAGVGAEIDAALTAAPLAELVADLVGRVPLRVAHNDAKLDNVLFRGADAICLVDLDTVMPTAWFWDVGDLLRSAATVSAEDDPRTELARVDPALYEAVLDGYRAGSSIATPSAAEIEALEHAGAIVTYEQALRFLADWIAGDVYYRTTRAGQNLDRARNQLALLASMPGTVGP